MAARAKITVRGAVQGVGFRPYVFTLAESLELKGLVSNTAEGVVIDIEGERLNEFIERLPRESPPLSRVVDIEVSPAPVYGYTEFRITESRDEKSALPFTLIPPDTSICEACLGELLDPCDRRYLYPFINCTNCGPRYTITRTIPYDRPHTTMSMFKMCAACEQEYRNPRDRRFHAEPNACPECGPQVTLVLNYGSQNGRHASGGDALPAAIELLREGKILAIKGLGGFHIACDATHDEAVKKLREGKRRSNKPFALMAPDVEAVRLFSEVSLEEEGLLLSNRRPIVLLRKKEVANHFLSQEISPNNRYLGFMLPYTPLHYLLFLHPGIQKPTITHSHFPALVMTSGNMSEEPIVRDNEEAREKLSGLVDAFLLHNRNIFMRVDDSVVKMSRKGEKASGPIALFARRSRGYAPEPIVLDSGGPEVMGCGADIKNTFTITKGSFAIPSQHIGDMENYETLRFFEESLENFKLTYRANPVALAHDIHPGYLSTIWALSHKDVPKVAFQHHYAHIGSVMAEHGLCKEVLGVALDGTGYGTDGNLWGGEFLIAGIENFERVGHFRYIPLPGGEMAIKEPWRTAVSYIIDALGERAHECLEALGFIKKFGSERIASLMKVRESRELSPLASGAGRLCDAISSIIGLCDRNTFEGEAAIALESLVVERVHDDYPFELIHSKPIVVDFSPAVITVIEDFLKGTDRCLIATKFHNTFLSAILGVVKKIKETYGVSDVALSGGTFQNMYILTKTKDLLMSEGLRVFINEKVPCNDACISLGQAFLLRERIKKGMDAKQA